MPLNQDHSDAYQSCSDGTKNAAEFQHVRPGSVEEAVNQLTRRCEGNAAGQIALLLETMWFGAQKLQASVLWMIFGEYARVPMVDCGSAL
jgi:hypothetical protein